MEKFFETHNNFRKLQLDTLPRHHPASGPSGLAGSRNATPPCNTPTPPIAVPPQLLRSSPVNSLQDSEDLSSLSSSGRYLESNYTVSPIELAARTKRSSIQFDPSAKLDAPGKHSKLQQHQNPVPRATPKIFSDDDSNFFEKKKVPSRTQSEASRFHYDSITGQLKGVGAVRNGPIEGKEQEGFGLGKITEGTKLQDGPPRRFLQANPSDVMMDEHGRMASLTSDSTASPPTEEYLHTPPMNQALGFGGHPFSHISRTHSYQDPISLHETSAWPRKLNSSQRNRSYNFEQPTRRSRRTSTASAGSAGSSGISPANQFLMGWSTVRAPDPDAEGQEVGPYVIGKQVGFGGFSIVKEVMTIKNNMRIKRAVKIVRKRAHTTESENDRIQAEFEHEVSLWRYLAHPYILPLIEVYDTPFATFCFTRLTTGGTLFDLVKASDRNGLPVEKAQKFSYQLASAIRYLHEDVRIIHRDIKLENCLIDLSVDDTGSLLLCDFGMAEQMPGSNDDDDDNHLTHRPSRGLDAKHPIHHIGGAAPDSASIACYLNGSLQYASPELVCAKTSILLPAVDMWAFGVVVFALHTGFLPFNHTFQPKLQMMITKGDWDKSAFRDAACRENPTMGMEAYQALQGCLQKNIDRRWNIGQVLNSRWLESISADSP